MIRAARLAAVVAPVLGLAALWLQSDRTYNSGTDWEVPIMGYDPRDYLRGHYVEFSYEWTWIGSGDVNLSGDGFCLIGQAPRLDGVKELKPSEVCPHPLRADGSTIYGRDGLMHGRLYIGQDRAAQLEEELRNRDQRGIVTIRQREDGSFTPISIRFRPLTPAEITERDAPIEGAEDFRPPPPIMSQ